MRIAFVTPEYVTEPSYSGGLANYLGRVTSALATAGHDVHVFTRSGTDEEIPFEGVHVHRVVPWWHQRRVWDRFDRFFRGQYYSPYQDWKAAKALHTRFRGVHAESPFDIVQCANVMAVGLYFRAETIPVVTRLSSFRPSWDTMAGVEPTRGVRIRWWMEKKAIQRSQHLYAPTHFVARETETAYRVGPVRVIETPYFHEQPLEDESVYRAHLNDRQYILFFGRMTQMKGTHLLAQSLVTVLQEHPQLHAVFVGNDSTSPSGDSMKDWVRRTLGGHSERLHLLDSMRHDQLYPILKRAHLVALPSVIDNLPNTCLEAMAHGRIVVATTGSCFEQLIEDGRNGLLASPGDVVSLTDTIRRGLQLTDSERQQMESAAVGRIAELRPEVKIPELIQYYQTLINGQSAG